MHRDQHIEQQHQVRVYRAAHGGAGRDEFRLVRMSSSEEDDDDLPALVPDDYVQPDERDADVVDGAGFLNIDDDVPDLWEGGGGGGEEDGGMVPFFRPPRRLSRRRLPEVPGRRRYEINRELLGGGQVSYYL